MKKRLLAIVTMMAIVATMVCVGSMSVSAADEVRYETPFIMDYGHADWFDPNLSWVKQATEEDGKQIIRWLADGGNININGQGNWGRPHYGQDLIKTDTEQYLRLYDKVEGDPGYRETAPTNESRYYFFVTAPTKAAGMPDALKVVLKVRKVGADWENASGVNLHTQFCDKAQNNLWCLDTQYNEELLAGPMNEWFEITRLIMIPEEHVGINSIQVMFDYGALTDAELHVQSVAFYVPVDMTKVPEVTPETATFDGSAPADVTVTVALKDFNLKPITLNGKSISGKYSLSADKTQLTFKKEYLATLENGEHVFAVNTLGGDATLTITVVNSTAGQGNTNPGGDTTPGGDTDTPKGGCGGIITATSAVLASALLAGAMLVFKKKED